MNEELLAAQFQAQRGRLHAMAYRMLGSSTEAEDAVQETWLRLSRSDANDVENLSGWLTTVVARVCLSMLRSRKSRMEEPLDSHVPEGIASHEVATNPEHEAVLGDSVGLALLVVLDTLSPPERIAFVLHDTFAVPFSDIATILKRSPAATRQLASRARRRLQGQASRPTTDVTRQRQIVEAFLSASRRGDFSALLVLLDPDVQLRADAKAVQMGANREILGAQAVAASAAARGEGAEFAFVNGLAGAVWAPRGRPRVAFLFTVTRGKITVIEMIANSQRLKQLQVTIPDA